MWYSGKDILAEFPFSNTIPSCIFYHLNGEFVYTHICAILSRICTGSIFLDAQ